MSRLRYSRVLIMVLAALAMDQGRATNLSAILPNRQGVAELKKENTLLAYRKFVEATAEDSFDPSIRLNLGLSYQLNKECDKAKVEYQLADQLAEGKGDVAFMARFNRAICEADAGDIDAALVSYQAALEIHPESKEVKENIELLWQSQSGGKGGKKDDKKNQKPQDNDKDGEGKSEDKKNQPQSGQEPKPDEKEKPKPKPFNSREMNQETVDKIMEELKAQEQRVRADHYSKGAKEQPRDKDW